MYTTVYPQKKTKPATF